MRGLFQIALQEAVIPLKHLQRLVSGDSHNSQVINARPPHVCDGRMAKVMEPEPLDLRSPARCLEGCLDGGNRFPVHQEDMRLVQVADFIQFFQFGGQVSGERDKPRLIGFRVFRLEPNQSRFQVDAIPRQVQDLPPSHAGLVGDQIDGLQVRGGVALQPFELLRHNTRSLALFSLSNFTKLTGLRSNQAPCIA